MIRPYRQIGETAIDEIARQLGELNREVQELRNFKNIFPINGNKGDPGQALIAFAVYTRTSTFVTTANNHVLITWQSLVESKGSWTAPNTSTITIPETGLYKVGVAGQYQGSGNHYHQMSVTLNETSVTTNAIFVSGSIQAHSEGASDIVNGISRPITLQQNDILRVFTYYTSAATFNVRGDVPFFWIERVE